MKYWIAIACLFATSAIVNATPHHYQPSQLVMSHPIATPSSLPFVTLQTPDNVQRISRFYQKKYPNYQLITQSPHYTQLAQSRSTKTGINAYADIPNIKIFRTPEHNSSKKHTLIQIFYAPPS